MSKIPDPPQEKSTGEDNSSKFLQEWKRLFNNIDPNLLEAYIVGDEIFQNFKKNFSWKATRLEGACDTNIQMLVLIKEHAHCLSFSPGYILFCLRNEAYSEGWIRELDENLDTLSQRPFLWEEIYMKLIENIKQLKNRIPDLPNKYKAIS